MNNDLKILVNYIDLCTQDLRLLIEEKYQKVGKEKMLSNELRSLLKFSGDGRAWGGLIFRLIRENIVAKDSEKPIKEGGRRYYLYNLVKDESIQKEYKLANEVFVIFNETTQEFKTVKGNIELDEKIEELLKTEDHVLKIFSQVGIAEKQIMIKKTL